MDNYARYPAAGRNCQWARGLGTLPTTA